MSNVEPISPDEDFFPASCPCANTNAADAHWKQHKVDCKSDLIKSTWRPAWEAEQRRPQFVQQKITSIEDTAASHGKKQFLWGNVPALDVLNLARNEGAAYAKDINLLFAASGDLRNVVKTITSLPPLPAPPPIAPKPTTTALLNDIAFPVVARNALLLLTALYVSPPPTAAAAMLHTWYSALLPAPILQTLRADVSPLINAVCDKTSNKPPAALLAKTFVSSGSAGSSVRIVLEKRHWDALRGYLDAKPEGLTVGEARAVRGETVCAEGRRDYADRVLFCQPEGGWRVARARWRREGVLVPFGTAVQGTVEGMVVPNPTLFQEPGMWPMMDSADPLAGWSLDDVLRKTPVAKNDIYGGLFFYLKELLVDFCEKVRTRKVDFVLLHKDAADLPRTLEKDFHLTQAFDRIEVSNIADGGYMGLRCLNVFAPLLRPLDENPHATLVTLFLNAIGEVGNREDVLATMYREMRRVVAYLPPAIPVSASDSRGENNNADSLRRIMAFNHFKDFDGLWERYKWVCSLDDVARDARLQAKSKHTIVEPWPLRLGENATKEEFRISLASSHCGDERYVEWKRSS